MQYCNEFKLMGELVDKVRISGENQYPLFSFRVHTKITSRSGRLLERWINVRMWGEEGSRLYHSMKIGDCVEFQGYIHCARNEDDKIVLYLNGEQGRIIYSYSNRVF